MMENFLALYMVIYESTKVQDAITGCHSDFMHPCYFSSIRTGIFSCRPHNCHEEIKSEQKIKQQKIKHLKKITKVSSTLLASNNHYTLDDTTVFQRNAAIVATQVAAEQRKKAADAKKTEGLQAALQKFDSCPNGLTAPELRAFVMAGSKSSDSPVKEKKHEQQEQLYCEPRYS
jgi:hypothetical protein